MTDEQRAVLRRWRDHLRAECFAPAGEAYVNRRLSATFAAIWPERRSEEEATARLALREYVDALVEFPGWAVEAGLKACVRDMKFRPVVAELRAEVALAAGEEWRAFQRLNSLVEVAPQAGKRRRWRARQPDEDLPMPEHDPAERAAHRAAERATEREAMLSLFEAAKRAAAGADITAA